MPNLFKVTKLSAPFTSQYSIDVCNAIAARLQSIYPGSQLAVRRSICDNPNTLFFTLGLVYQGYFYKLEVDCPNKSGLYTKSGLTEIANIVSTYYQETINF